MHGSIVPRQRCRTRLAILGAVLALGFTNHGFCYPIPPVPLWDLVRRAEVIVFARVSAISTAEPDSPEDEPFDSGIPLSIAHLETREVWKGTAPRRLSVKFPESLICPRPPRFLKGEEVLAFLAADGETGELEVVGLSYGTLYPKDGVAAFRGLVTEAIEMQANGRPSDTHIIDWLLRAVEHAETRWHGLYPLTGDESMEGEDDEFEPTRFSSLVLTREQRARIAEAFLASPGSIEMLDLILSVLDGYPDASVDEAAISIVEAALEEDRLAAWYSAGSVKALLKRLAIDGGADPVELLSGDMDQSSRAEKMRGFWSLIALEYDLGAHRREAETRAP